MKTQMIGLYGLFLLVTLLCFVSCKKERSEQSFGKENAVLKTETNADVLNTARFAGLPNEALLKQVHSATARFHATKQAVKTGYQPGEHCVASPVLGGMGYHWPNPGLIDEVMDPLRPEVLLYATGKDGELELVAVEYVVLNTGQTAPMFGDQPFDVGGAPLPAPHWTLHVWLHKHNPAGIFTPFNPDVTCP